MKDRQLRFSIIALALSLSTSVMAAEAPSFAGEYADKKLLNGKAVFQMSIEGSGNSLQIWFSAVYNDGREPDPEGQGQGKVTQKGTVEFKFEDNFNNSGTGTITRSGDDIVVSMKTTRVVDRRCLVFYGQNMRLKPAGKK